MRLFAWLKQNKIATLLLIIVLYLIGKNVLGSIFSLQSKRQSFSYPSSDIASPGIGGKNLDFSQPLQNFLPKTGSDYAPSPETTDRLVVHESYLSLLVQDVKSVTDKIIEYAKSNGGYMVNSSLESPQESPSGTVIIRIPSTKLTAALDYLRNLSIKVVSENLVGEDVTDQYVDVESRLSTLYKTKVKFEDILEKAVNVQEILNVQREIINLQSQIDSLKGQKQYLEKNAQMAKVTIYVSTDEIALPFTPIETWRPNVIFKLAIRSLIGNLRNLGTLTIWVIVYSVIWIPILLIIYFLKRRTVRKIQ